MNTPRRTDRQPIAAVIFDLDGVIVDSERSWGESRMVVASRLGGRWTEEDEASVKGANSAEWSAAMTRRLGGIDPQPAVIEAAVIEVLLDRYRRDAVPHIRAGIDAVRRLSARWPLAVASSAASVVIEAALGAVGLRDRFRILVSSDEVGAGKPSPAVYLEAARRLGAAPATCLVIEDSPNGVRAAHRAGMRVILVSGAATRPRPGTEAEADLVLASLDELDDSRLRALGAE